MGDRAARTCWERRDGLAMAGIFALALVLRFVYLWQIRDIPLFTHPIVDALAYDTWARRIAAGDWIGHEAFYQAPAYPYFLALIYRIAGHDLWTAHAVQMVLGSLSCVLIFVASRALFSFGAALAAGLILAGHAPAIFFDGVLGKQGLGLFSMCALLAALLWLQVLRRSGLCLLAGAVLGLLALTRENALAFLPAIPIWLGFRFRTEPVRRRLGWIAVFLLGASVLLVPVALRNALLGGAFAPTTTQLGSNFYIGNGEAATGLYVPLLPGRHTPLHEASDAKLLAERALGRPLDRGEVSRYWLGRGLDFVAAHPLDWLRLLAVKLALTWNEFEIADTEDIYVHADWSALLRWLLPWLHFGTLAPLAALGLFLAWGRRRDPLLLAWLLLVYTASVVLFITSARFRYPLVPLLVPLAGHGLVEGLALLRSERRSRLVPATAALVLVALLVNMPLIDERRFAMSGRANLGLVMLEQGRPDEAEPYLLAALEVASDEADLQLRMGWMRLLQNRLAEAEKHLLAMIALDDGDHRGHRMLARVYQQMGRSREARIHARLAARLDPDRRAGTATAAGPRP